MAKPERKNWSYCLPKEGEPAKTGEPTRYLPAAAVAVLVVLALIATTAMLRQPARMTIAPQPTPAAVPTDAAPTAAPALAATSQPRATDVPFVPVDNSAQNAPIPAPAPQQEAVDQSRPPDEPPAMLAEPAEVPATPLVFVQGACAAWHPPMAKIEGCP